jgi:hypothetical protein
VLPAGEPVQGGEGGDDEGDGAVTEDDDEPPTTAPQTARATWLPSPCSRPPGCQPGFLKFFTTGSIDHLPRGRVATYSPGRWTPASSVTTLLAPVQNTDVISRRCVRRFGHIDEWHIDLHKPQWENETSPPSRWTKQESSHSNRSWGVAIMSDLFLFTRPRFTARTVARVIGHRLGRRLTYQEPDEMEALDGAVDITNRVHVQVGADYLVVCAWESDVETDQKSTQNVDSRASMSGWCFDVSST